MNPEDLIDWNAIPGSEWYRPGEVARSIAGIRNCDPSAPDILYRVANNHAGELYPAAVVASSILLEIAIRSNNQTVANQALAVLDTLVWFRGESPFQTTIYAGVEVALDKAIRLQIEASRPQLIELADREPRTRRMVLMLLQSIGEQATE